MPSTSFFPRRPDIHPIIYAYRDKNPENKGLLKIGDTTRTAEIRVTDSSPSCSPVTASRMKSSLMRARCAPTEHALGIRRFIAV